MTPYYQDAHVTLDHVDCLELTEWLEADVLVTDPPYGIGWSKGDWAKSNTPGANVGIQNDDTTGARDKALQQWGAQPAIVFGSLQAKYPKNWDRMLVFEKPLNAGQIGRASCRERVKQTESAQATRK